MHTALTLRPITAADRDLLHRIYASTRTEELAPVPWTDEQKAAFLHMQFEAQYAYYAQHYPDAQFQIILLDGRPAGRLYVDRRADEIRIVDIALLPEFRGQGLGTALLGQLLAEGDQAGLPVTIHVEAFNPAQRLYRRLGFQMVEDKGVYYFMERRPGQR